MTIRTKITILFSLCFAAPLFLSALFWVNAVFSTTQDLTWSSLWHGPTYARNQLAKRYMVYSLDRNSTVVRFLAPTQGRFDAVLEAMHRRLQRNLCQEKGVESPECRERIRSSLARQRDVGGLLVLADGRAVLEVDGGGPQGPSPLLRPLLLPLADAGPAVRLQPILVNGEVLLAGGQRSDGSPAMTVVGWSRLAELLGPLNEVFASASAFMQTTFTDTQGRVLAPFEWKELAHLANLDMPDEQGRSVAEGIRRGDAASGQFTVKGVLFGFAHAPIPETGLHVVTLTRLDIPAWTRILNALQDYLFGSLLALAVVALGASLLVRRMTRRLDRLTVAAEEIKAGHLDTPIDVAGQDEIARLAASFQGMAARLGATLEGLEQTVADRTRDLTLRTEELERVNADLVRLTRLKSDFFARMSHELRTPLNSIIGFSELLLSGDCGPLTEDQQTTLEPVLRNGKALLRLINDILDLSKIEADRLTLRLGTVHLKPVVDSAVSNVALKAAQKALAIKVEVDPEIPPLVSDEARLQQILNNLLSNAVKFTDAGSVTVTVRLTDPTHLALRVADTGIGMEAKDLPKLFSEFFQTSESQGRRQEGTGLGLAITKRLVEALGGRIEVQSHPGAGTTFTVALPLVAAETPPAPAPQPETTSPPAEPPSALPPAHPTSILLIDDTPEAHQLIAELLRETGARLLSARDGATGLRMARSERPDLILLDIRLPDQDGWQVLHNLKADPDTGEIPVVITSVVDDQPLGFSLGAADYLVKPVGRDTLFRALGRLGVNPESGHVLVVEDDHEAGALIRQGLEAKGFHVELAHDGQQALQRIRERAPRLIVLDLLMPVMDGFELLSTLKAEAATREIPVVILTSKDLTPEEQGALEGRIQSLHQKGAVSMEQLSAEIQRVIAAREAHP